MKQWTQHTHSWGIAHIKLTRTGNKKRNILKRRIPLTHGRKRQTDKNSNQMRSNNLIRPEFQHLRMTDKWTFIANPSTYSVRRWNHLIVEYHYAFPLCLFLLIDVDICDFVHTFRDLNTHSFHLHSVSPFDADFVVALSRPMRCCFFSIRSIAIISSTSFVRAVLQLET